MTFLDQWINTWLLILLDWLFSIGGLSTTMEAKTLRRTRTHLVALSHLPRQACLTPLKCTSDQFGRKIIHLPRFKILCGKILNFCDKWYIYVLCMVWMCEKVKPKLSSNMRMTGWGSLEGRKRWSIRIHGLQGLFEAVLAVCVSKNCFFFGGKFLLWIGLEILSLTFRQASISGTVSTVLSKWVMFLT